MLHGRYMFVMLPRHHQPSDQTSTFVCNIHLPQHNLYHTTSIFIYSSRSSLAFNSSPPSIPVASCRCARLTTSFTHNTPTQSVAILHWLWYPSTCVDGATFYTLPSTYAFRRECLIVLQYRRYGTQIKCLVSHIRLSSGVIYDAILILLRPGYVRESK